MSKQQSQLLSFGVYPGSRYEFDQEPDPYSPYAPEPGSEIISVLEYPAALRPYYSGKGGWAEMKGIALVRTGKVFRLCPVKGKNGRVTIASSLATKADADGLRALAEMLNIQADLLDAESANQKENSDE